MTAETRSLHRKLAQVMYEAERIPKNGTAPKEMGGYPFVQVGDAADYIRKALAEKVITMMPTNVQVVAQHEGTTKAGAPIMTVDLITEWTLTDGESGESITIMSYGAGADVGDKYSGKASTSAMKYALLTGFLLSTGEDSEASAVPEREPKDAGGTETLELLGRIQKAGRVEKGGASGYQAEWRETPEGHAIGFRLNIDGEDRAIPQVLVIGGIGEALYLGHPTILGERITVKGHLYNVKVPGRKGYYRLVVGEHPDSEFIETSQIRIPALLDPEQDIIPIVEGQESFDLAESARIDAEEVTA